MHIKIISRLQVTFNNINFSLALIAASSAQDQAPDCVSIARETPEDISKYYHHHENDCNKYYQCAEYGLVLKNCPLDLHFDRNLHICGYDYEVQC